MLVGGPPCWPLPSPILWHVMPSKSCIRWCTNFRTCLYTCHLFVRNKQSLIYILTPALYDDWQPKSDLKLLRIEMPFWLDQGSFCNSPKNSGFLSYFLRNRSPTFVVVALLTFPSFCGVPKSIKPIFPQPLISRHVDMLLRLLLQTIGHLRHDINNLPIKWQNCPLIGAAAPQLADGTCSLRTCFDSDNIVFGKIIVSAWGKILESFSFFVGKNIGVF